MAYTIILSDSLSSNTFILPEEPIIYKDLGSALEAMMGLAATMNAAKILYGEAFPYESTTFEQHLEEKGFAFYGQGLDGDYWVPIGLKRVTIV